MNRYQIALNKEPEEAKKDNLIKTFGFGDVDEIVIDRVPKSHLHDLFWPNEEPNRIGILYKDPLSVFISSNVHYYVKGKYYFLCKSDWSGVDPSNGYRAPCCTASLKPDMENILGKSMIRAACAIIHYVNFERGLYSIKPWVFGKRVLNRISSFEQLAPVEDVDLNVSKFKQSQSFIMAHFNQIEISPFNTSQWQKDPETRARILQEAEPVFAGLKKYLGHDHSEVELRDILSNLH